MYIYIHVCVCACVCVCVYSLSPELEGRTLRGVGGGAVAPHHELVKSLRKLLQRNARRAAAGAL